MRAHILLLLFFVMLPLTLKATIIQHPYYVSVNSSNGLPSDEVYDIYEDKRGFFWLATGAGLYRYDGFSCVPWQNEQQTSLPGSCIRQDRFGRIWYENFDGYLYYTDGEKLRALKQNQPCCYMPFGITEKYLFVLQTKGIDVFDLSTLSLVKTLNISIEKQGQATNSNQAYYLAADETIYYIDTLLSLSSYHLPATNDQGLRQLFYEYDRLYVLPRTSGKNIISVYNNKLQPINQIAIDEAGYGRGIVKIDGDLWLYTSSGCVTISGADSREKRTLFSGKSISRVLRDRNGNYWFATTNEGLFIVPDLNSIVYNLGDTKIRQVSVTGTGVLAATHSGELMHLSDNRIRTEKRDPNNADIYYLYADDDNIIYSSTGHSMISAKGFAEKSAGYHAIKAVVSVDQKYYAAAASGTCILLPKQGRGNQLRSAWDTVSRFGEENRENGIITLLKNVRARSVAYDSGTRTIFFATNSGIMAISPDSTFAVTYKGQPVFAAHLAAFGGYVYAADTKGRLLLISGSYKIEMPDNIAGSGSIRLLKVSGGRLFYFAAKRLYECISPSEVRGINMYIDADEINDIAATDTCLWFATNRGLMAMDQSRRLSNVQLPGFYINHILVNDSVATKSNLLALSFRENNITINFSILDFAASVPVQLSYSINGSTWKDLPGDTRSLQFRSLSPGSYVVRFRLDDKETTEQVSFNISSPFWQQAWFYVLCVLVVLTVLQVYNSYRMKAKMKKVEAQKNKIKLEERLSRSMLTALRSQMNPHFFFNALNTVQAYIFTNEKSKAGDYLAKLSMLTRTILEMSEAETVLLSQELEALNLYLDLEKERFGNDFRYDIKIVDIPEPAAFEIPSMILQPFVENAVKHGLMHKEGVKILNILFALAANELHITIDDNGIGRARSEMLNEIKNRKYKSYSTRATGERVKLLNAITANKIAIDIKDKTNADGVATGTKVTIKIKL
jgi:hypothetical protein